MVIVVMVVMVIVVMVILVTVIVVMVGIPENIQSIPVLPYSSAIVDKVAERHTY